VSAMESVVDAAVTGRSPGAVDLGPCSLGASVVLRAVDRAASRGASDVVAAEAGVRAGAGYLRLAAELQGVSRVDECLEQLVAQLLGRLGAAQPTRAVGIPVFAETCR
jgi:hypothetical protein